MEVLDGPDTGTKAVSNSKGEFELVISSPFQAVKIRASKEGYQPLTSNATSAPAGSFASVIVRLSGSESYDALTAGEYTLTIAFDRARARSRIADAPCPAFPDDLISRNYEVSVAASPAGVRSVGITRLPAGPQFAFPLFVADDRVVFDFGDDGLIEDIPGFRVLSVWAWVPPSNPSVMSVGSSISFPVAAEFRYCQLKGPRGIYNDCSQVPPYERLAYHSCVSDDAVMRFTRR